MEIGKRARLVASGAVLAFSMSFAALTAPSYAQEFTEAHLKAARAAITALHATDDFDNLLPIAAQQLRSELIQQSPNMVDRINQIVDDAAISLVSRRADLEKEVASIYAQAFTLEELQGLAEFYSSAIGKKFLERGPQVTQEVVRGAEIWRNGIMRDLSTQVLEKVSAEMGAAAGAAPAGDAPAAAAPQ